MTTKETLNLFEPSEISAKLVKIRLDSKDKTIIQPDYMIPVWMRCHVFGHNIVNNTCTRCNLPD